MECPHLQHLPLQLQQQTELSGSGLSVGYRQMHQRLTSDHGLVVSREIVRIALKCLDPEGVARRKGHRLTRRKYFCKVHSIYIDTITIM